MYRKAMDELIAWKGRPHRKPLIMRGARQVGKTWLALEFGRTQFSHVAHVVFLDNQPMLNAFEGSLDPARLLSIISAETGVPVGTDETLIVLDEIQECPRALTALKLFCEQRPEVPIIAAGSLLGVAFHRGVSFPVGKVEYLDLHPLTFQEFLFAMGADVLACAVDEADLDIIGVFAERYTDLLKQYYFVGGMPEAVEAYRGNGDFTAARSVQDRLLSDYELDFSKHADPLLAERVRGVWRSMPSQLARENKKFIYSAVRSGARARGYEEAIAWLVDAGLLTRVSRIAKSGLPLSAYRDLSAFKLYLLDVGLLGAMSRLSARTIVDGSELFREFKGALTEQYVCQQLVAANCVVPHYWSAENARGEVDFVYDYEGIVVPVEVKAAENVRSRSLRTFAQENSIERSVRLSLAGFADQGWMCNIPLYAAGLLPKELDEL